MSSRTALACLGPLLLGSVLMIGCTPDSSGSPSPPDTTTVDTSSSASGGPMEASHSPTPDAEDRTVAQRLQDASVATRVKQALVRTQSLRQFDFAPTVVRGHLTLRGDVNTREQHRRAERVAKNLADVATVTNQVTVQGRVVTEETASSAKGNAVYHTVRPGDTLSEIARAYDVSTQQLRALNDLSAPLRPGERLRVR